MTDSQSSFPLKWYTAILMFIGIFIVTFFAIMMLAVLNEDRVPGQFSKTYTFSTTEEKIFDWILKEEKLREWKKGYINTEQIDDTNRYKDTYKSYTVIREITTYNPYKTLSFTLLSDKFNAIEEYVFTREGEKVKMFYKTKKIYNSALGNIFEPALTYLNERKINREFLNLQLLIAQEPE